MAVPANNIHILDFFDCMPALRTSSMSDSCSGSSSWERTFRKRKRDFNSSSSGSVERSPEKKVKRDNERSPTNEGDHEMQEWNGGGEVPPSMMFTSANLQSVSGIMGCSTDRLANVSISGFPNMSMALPGIFSTSFSAAPLPSPNGKEQIVLPRVQEHTGVDLLLPDAEEESDKNEGKISWDTVIQNQSKSIAGITPTQQQTREQETNGQEPVLVEASRIPMSALPDSLFLKSTSPPSGLTQRNSYKNLSPSSLAMPGAEMAQPLFNGSRVAPSLWPMSTEGSSVAHPSAPLLTSATLFGSRSSSPPSLSSASFTSSLSSMPSSMNSREARPSLRITPPTDNASSSSNISSTSSTATSSGSSQFSPSCKGGNSTPVDGILSAHLNIEEESVSSAIVKLNAHSNQVASMLMSIRNQLRALSTGKAHAPKILDEQQQLRGLIGKNQLELEGILDLHILPTNAHHDVIRLQTSAHLQMAQLSIYEREVHVLLSGTASMVDVSEASLKGLVALVVVEQPFPASALKGSVLRDSVVVALLVPAVLAVRSAGDVAAQPLYSFAGEFGVKNGTQALRPVRTSGSAADKPGSAMFKAASHFQVPAWDAVPSMATFPDLIFTASSRQQFVKLQFCVDVEFPGGAKLTVKSQPTESIIVMANQPSQWLDSEVSLLIQEGFHRENSNKELLHITWARFCNALQSRIARITRSDVRPLSQGELLFMHERLNRQVMVSRHDVELFWSNWFGTAFRLVRDPRKNMGLWTRGLVFFLSKESAEDVLRDEMPGTFLARFSTSCPDSLCISVKRVNNVVEHLLMKYDQKKKVTDLLAGSTPGLDRMMRVKISPETGESAYTAHQKLLILKK